MLLTYLQRLNTLINENVLHTCHLTKVSVQVAYQIMQGISIIMSLTVFLDEAEYHLKNYGGQGGLGHGG